MGKESSSKHPKITNGEVSITGRAFVIVYKLPFPTKYLSVKYYTISHFSSWTGVEECCFGKTLGNFPSLSARLTNDQSSLTSWVIKPYEMRIMRSRNLNHFEPIYNRDKYWNCVKYLVHDPYLAMLDSHHGPWTHCKKPYEVAMETQKLLAPKRLFSRPEMGHVPITCPLEMIIQDMVTLLVV